MIKTLFLLDGMALIYRAYHALKNNPRVTSYQKNTNAQFGFTNTLVELMQKEKPTHMAVVLDTHKPTQRHLMFDAYKANRQDTPEDIIQALPDIQAIVEGFNITLLAIDGYEADDIIGTLSQKAMGDDFDTYIVSPDKDFGQLVSAHVHLYKPAYQRQEARILREEEVRLRWQIKDTKQLIDILALMGDSVDNIPGIKGIGEKTAIKLIAEYGNIEAVIEAAKCGNIQGSLQHKILTYKQDALMSKQLATIILDVPIAITWENFLLRPLDKHKLKSIFQALEFKTLAKRLLDEHIGASYAFDHQDNHTLKPYKTYDHIGTLSKDYKLMATLDEVKDLVRQLLGHRVIAFDTETTSLDTANAQLIGMSFAVQQHQAYYIQLSFDRVYVERVLQVLSPLFQGEEILWVGQNIKYDMAVLANYACFIQGSIFDTMVAHYLLDSESKRNMDFLSQHYLNYQPIALESLIGSRGKRQLKMDQVDIQLLKDYACEDADVTLQLHLILKDQLLSKNLWDLFFTVEMPLLKVLFRMEQKGLCLDLSFLKQLSYELGNAIMAKENTIYQLTQLKFNIASPKQLGEVLFNHLKITSSQVRKTKTGQYATNEEVLSKLKDKHPVMQEIIEYRELVKLKSTYVDAIPLLLRKKSSRIHTIFNQTMTVTGRLSSYNPNLQNIPIRTSLGKQVRKAFIAPDDNYVLLSADYSQIELRIIAALSHDVQMIEAFQQNKDIHTATAARIYNIAEHLVDKTMRYKAKSVNFGIIYGQGAFGLAQNLNISRTEAKALIESYFQQYPGIKHYMTSQIALAKKQGFVTTILGRRRWLKNINSSNANLRMFDERNAINMPIQGTAADMIKMAMINIDKQLPQYASRSFLILQVHDELLFEVHNDEIAIVKSIVEEEMTKALVLPYQVPIKIDIGMGHNWLEAH